MKEIRLNKLSIRDFQGGTFTLDAKGKDAFIFGENASGKTRVVSAFTWLLFGKDALGRSDFEIKNLDAQGEAAHGLEHTVEAELSIDGKIETLKKVYKEKWTRKRGQAEREFSGHTVDYFVDGVPLQEKLYIQHIADLTGDESRFRLLTSPTVFPALHWQRQRALLLEICGDVSDEDVIASNEKLSSLTAILGKHTLDDHRKIVLARRSEINKEMEKIPIRIDEVRRGIPITEGIDRKAEEKAAQELETALNDAKLRLQGINTGGIIADLTRKLSGLNADLRKIEDAHRSGSLSTLNRLNQQISELQSKINGSQRRRSEIDGDMLRKGKLIQNIENDLANLRKRWMEIDTEIFNDTISDTCPTCGQPLPAERVQESRERALASFNMNKADRLGEIDRKGQALKADRDKLKQQIEAFGFELAEIETSAIETRRDLKKTTEERDLLKMNSEDFSGIQGRADLLDEIEDLEAQIKAEREGVAQDAEKVKEERASIQGKLTVVKDRLDKFARREQGEKRIEELKAEEKNLSKEFEKLEGELYLMDEFIKTKVSLLTEKINSKFEMVRFKLFHQNINGGIEEVCEITVNGVPYNAGLNNAARIQAGCDIIRTLQQHLEMKAPVFVDNREAVTDLPAMGCQLISLIVSPEDKTLRVEIKNEDRKRYQNQNRSNKAGERASFEG